MERAFEIGARIAALFLGSAALIFGIASLRNGIPARFELVPLHHTPALALLAVLVGPVLIAIGLSPKRFW